MTLKVGDTFTSNNFGRYKVGKLDGTHVWIVFEDTGNVEHPSVKTVVANAVVDYKGAYALKMGCLYNTNNYGKVRVVEIVDSKEITVEFINTGNRVVSQKNTILAGALIDKMAVAIAKEEQFEINRQRKQLEEAERRSAREFERQKKLLDAEDKKSAKELERLALIAVKRTLNSLGEVFLGTTHTDRLGMEYKIVDRIDGTSRWVVKYQESENEYQYTEYQINKGSVYDKKLDDFFKLKCEYDKTQASLWYQQNRDSALNKAKAYQKNNLDRARVNNQNRRARREGADGRHTLEEVDMLLKEQDYKCACCNTNLKDSNKHLDHKYPLALGGTNYIWNLQWLCQFCNNSKSDAHPDDWEIYSKSEHFQQLLKSRQTLLQ